jgi:hypothetical protein
MHVTNTGYSTKHLYVLHRSPHHWYNMFTRALTEIGLNPSIHDPCLFSGTLSLDTSIHSSAKIYFGIYVDDFVFFSKDPAVEEQLINLLFTKVVVEFMGDVDYFLGAAFQWTRHDNSHLSLHLCQSAFTEYTAHNRAPNMTPYRRVCPLTPSLLQIPKIPTQTGKQNAIKASFVALTG